MINQNIYDIDVKNDERREKVANRIEALRKETINPETGKAYTQEAFAKKLGYSLVTYKGWIGTAKGKKVTMPSITQLSDIAYFCKCDIGYLLCEEGYEKGGIVKTDICAQTNLSKEAVTYLCENKETSGFTSYLLENLKGIEKAVTDEKKLKQLLKQWKVYDDFDIVDWCFEKALKNVKQPLTVEAYFSDGKNRIIDYARELYYQTVEFEEGKKQLGFDEAGNIDERALNLMLSCLYELSKHDERLFTIQKIFLNVVEKYMKQE